MPVTSSSSDATLSILWGAETSEPSSRLARVPLFRAFRSGSVNRVVRINSTCAPVDCNEMIAVYAADSGYVTTSCTLWGRAVWHPPTYAMSAKADAIKYVFYAIYRYLQRKKTKTKQTNPLSLTNVINSSMHMYLVTQILSVCLSVCLFSLGLFL